MPPEILTLKLLLGNLGYSLGWHSVWKKSAEKRDLSFMTGCDTGCIVTAVRNIRDILRAHPKTWQQYSTSTDYANPSVSTVVATAHLRHLQRAYRMERGRDASDFDLAVLWQRGLSGYRRLGFDPARLPVASRDRAQRVINLMKI